MIESTIQNKIREQKQNEISTLDKKVLVQLDMIAPRSYVKQMEEWLTNAHAGDYKDIARQRDIPIHEDMAKEIAEAVYEDMRNHREEYDLPPVNISDT